jgi:hypothetical protein
VSDEDKGKSADKKRKLPPQDDDVQKELREMKGERKQKKDDTAD